MSDPKKISSEEAKDSNAVLPLDQNIEVPPRKGPISFLSGALTSGLLAWLCLLLSQKMVAYFTIHSPHYSSAIAQSIASGFKTLVIGMCFLATFTFAFIGLGLTLVFFRSLFDGKATEVT